MFNKDKKQQSKGGHGIGYGSTYATDRGSETDNWALLFKEIDTLKQQSTKVSKELDSLQQQTTQIDKKKLDSSINRIDDSLAKLSDYIEDRLNTNSIKIQKNETIMYEMNSVVEKKLMILEKKFYRQEILSELYSKRKNLIIYGIPEKKPKWQRSNFT